MRSAGFLRTTVGRRLFTRFLLAALVPATLTAVIAATFVRSEVRAAIESRVSRGARLAGLGTLATLERLEVTFRQTLAVRSPEPGPWQGTIPPGFSSVETRPIAWGLPGDGLLDTRPLSAAEQEHLQSGRTLLVMSKEERPALLMAALDETHHLVQWARVENDAIWGPVTKGLLDENARLCVIELAGQRMLACSHEVPAAAQQKLGKIRSAGGVGLAAWDEGSTKMYAASWNVFLRYAYGAAEWRVIVSHPSNTTFASLRGFTLTFSGILVLSLLSVLFLSHAQIRLSTEPLEQLQAGTRRLESGDFTTAVRVESRDEFNDLADSFNRMASTLDRQIVTLRGLDELHQSVLWAQDCRVQLETALRRVGALVREADVLVAVKNTDGSIVALQQSAGSSLILPANAALARSEADELMRASGVIVVPPGQRRGFLSGFRLTGASLATHVFPLVREHSALGFIAVAIPPERSLDGDQFEGVRRLADRLTLAVAEAQHVRHLAALSEGTMTAFARAIEANSRWTAGHSERVTALAMMTAERMGLSREEISLIHRGGLLHDIGKIGVPATVLDKPAALTPLERALVERHPVMGAEILAPIGAFTDAIPIVRSHHEQWNGTGYPDRLAGEEIPFLARILAVADVFDALVSDRPYRAGLSVSHAAGFIELGSGSHFDPEPAAAFLDTMRDGELVRVLGSFERESRLTSIAPELEAVEHAA